MIRKEMKKLIVIIIVLCMLSVSAFVYEMISIINDVDDSYNDLRRRAEDLNGWGNTILVSSFQHHIVNTSKFTYLTEMSYKAGRLPTYYDSLTLGEGRGWYLADVFTLEEQLPGKRIVFYFNCKTKPISCQNVTFSGDVDDFVQQFVSVAQSLSYPDGHRFDSGILYDNENIIVFFPIYIPNNELFIDYHYFDDAELLALPVAQAVDNLYASFIRELLEWKKPQATTSVFGKILAYFDGTLRKQEHKRLSSELQLITVSQNAHAVSHIVKQEWDSVNNLKFIDGSRTVEEYLANITMRLKLLEIMASSLQAESSIPEWHAQIINGSFALEPELYTEKELTALRNEAIEYVYTTTSDMIETYKEAPFIETIANKIIRLRIVEYFMVQSILLRSCDFIQNFSQHRKCAQQLMATTYQHYACGSLDIMCYVELSQQLGRDICNYASDEGSRPSCSHVLEIRQESP